MEISDFESNVELQAILNRAKTKLAAKVYSDVVDDAGNQYIDLVMEGGGMLGIALVGYIYVLESAGLRFRGIGGTSAGSITALLLAALDVPANPKGKKLLYVLATKNFYDFVDGGDQTRTCIDALFHPEKNFVFTPFLKRWISIYKFWKYVIFTVKRFKTELGLNPGNAFHEWITNVLKNENIITVKDLEARMGVIPSGLKRVNRLLPEEPPEFITTADAYCPKLAIIASDITTESKVEFPLMAKLYWSEPEKVNPADFVRASMAIPIFFKPHIIKDIPNGLETASNWNEVGYDANSEGVPMEAVFIDGGIMSNFPIDAFHTPHKVPDAPTFGIKLELDNRRHVVSGIFSWFWAIFNTARHTLDYDFIYKNPDYRLLVKYIPAKGFNWLDFNMSSENKLKLFLEGARCAESFLTNFNWDKYKQLRQIVVDEYAASASIKPIKEKKSNK